MALKLTQRHEKLLKDAELASEAAAAETAVKALQQRLEPKKVALLVFSLSFLKGVDATAIYRAYKSIACSQRQLPSYFALCPCRASPSTLAQTSMSLQVLQGPLIPRLSLQQRLQLKAIPLLGCLCKLGRSVLESGSCLHMN